MAPKPKPDAEAQPASASVAAAPAATLTAALLAAQITLPMVKKDATNSFHKYNYASAEGMIQACREVLHEHGLAVQRTGWIMLPPNGSAWDYGTIVSDMLLVHVASNERVEAKTSWPIVPEKGRPIDKAIAGALTSSLSYWLRDLLMVPREEEGMDNRDDRSYEPPPAHKLPPLPNAKPVSPLPPKAAPPPAKEPEADPDLSPVPSKTRTALVALMANSAVTEAEVEKVTAMNGMVQNGTPFADFDEKCLSKLVAAWERVVTVIESKVRN